MNEETKQKLQDAGREDLIEAYEITASGYSGIMPDGRIVDRRKHPSAIPVPENKALNIPPPKDVTVCPECLRPCDQDELDMFGGLCEDCIPTL